MQPAATIVPVLFDAEPLNQLETQRLQLRPMRGTDVGFLQSLYGDSELMRFITGRPRSPWETRARLKKDLRHHATYGFGLCIAVWKDDGRAIGRCGLEPVIGPEGLEGELAWMFSKSWWGQGLASEAGLALTSFGLGELGLHRVFAESDPANHASIRVMQKIGMRSVESTGESVVYEMRQGDLKLGCG